MAQSASERRAAQRKLARALKRGESVLGGEFQAYVYDELFARGASPDDDTVLFTYDPTKTTWPQNGWDHRRTTRAGYNRATRTLRIQFFTNGAIYDYFDVPPAVARQFRRVESPGRYINAILNNYDYERIS